MTPAELLPQVYDELRRLAAAKLAGQSAGQTLDATALVHEAWLKLDKASFQTNSPTHFVKVAATAMRQILVDRARARLTAKRSGGQRQEWDDLAAPMPDERLLAVDEALIRLAAIKPDHAKLLELKYFAGLTGDEAAAALGISPSSVDRMSRYSLTWLEAELTSDR